MNNSEEIISLKIIRLLDANVNRTREGLRVLEDITRFIKDDKKLSSQFKRIRHKITTLVKKLPIKEEALIKNRNVFCDIGKKVFLKSEEKRDSLNSLFKTNIHRVEEALRVLEEFTKLYNSKISFEFKKIRYKIYSLEKFF